MPRFNEEARPGEDVILSTADRFTLSNNCLDSRAEIETGRDKLNVSGESKSAE